MPEPEKSIDRTIDQLAQEANIPTSTVRMYQNKGILPPPEKRGRVGIYNTEHAERLQVIADLQERGFSLAAIKETLSSWQAGQSISQLMGVEKIGSKPTQLSVTEMLKYFSKTRPTSSDLKRAEALGMIKIEGRKVFVRNSAFLDIGEQLSKLGLPISDILDEYEALLPHIDQMAQRFKEVFEQQFWADFEARGMPADDIGGIATTAGQLSSIASQVIASEMHDRFADYTSEFIARAAATK